MFILNNLEIIFSIFLFVGFYWCEVIKFKWKTDAGESNETFFHQAGVCFIVASVFTLALYGLYLITWMGLAFSLAILLMFFPVQKAYRQYKSSD